MKSTPYAGTSNFKSVKSATGSLHLEAPSKKTTTDATPKPTFETKQKQKQRTHHTHAEVWKWTLTQHAIAPCRVEDIYDLQECDSAKPGVDPDYFWLGNVPCRSVLIYGMVVGVQVYEQRVVYTIDDGTGKIDCNLREAKSQNTIAKGKGNDSPKKQHAPSASRSNPQASSSKAPPTLMTLPTPPVPIAAVGDIVRATGRVLQRRDARLINLDNLTICHNATEEPLHWLSVLNLHETWYNSPTTSPFIIPPPPPVSTTIASSSRRPSISEREGEQEDTRGIRAMPPPLYPVSPSKSSVASSAPSSPSSVASSSVSGSSHHGPMSPPRLRHPSRLHTRDLTANTFRIYVKHYMDNTPPDPSVRPRRPAGLGPLPSDSSEDEDAWGDQGDPGTPTKPRRGHGVDQYVVDLTPRPPRKVGRSDMTTPRVQPMKKGNESDGDEDEDGERESVASTGLRGYTLSHLRRVPELALLARRVVEAEYKRRAKEQRKKQKEEQLSKSQHPSASKSNSSSSSHSFSRSSYASTSSSHRHASGSTPTTARSTSVALGKGKEGEPIGAKMKRLFRYAVRQLYEEGSIVLWDGPVRPHPRRFTPIPRPSFTSSNVKMESETNVSSGRLWKMSSSASASISMTGESTMSVRSASMVVTERSLLEDDLDELSDAPVQEEAYIPLTSPYLAKIIEQAISEIMSRSHSHSRSHGYGYVKKGPPPPGPTVDEIVRYLHRKDERWARVGEWAVKEALEWGRESGRVWCVGDGRWEVCG